MKCEVLAWESELLGKQAGRVLSFDGRGELAASGYDFLVAQAAAGEEQRLVELVRAGFALVETALVLTRSDGRIAEPVVGAEVREASDAEVEEASRIAHDTFRHSRFHSDPCIPDRIARRSRQEWVLNARRQGRGTVLVALVEGSVAGFLVHRPQEDTSVLDLIGVEPSQKRRGIGRALVAGYLRGSRARSFRVTTQATNLESLGLYQATGYRIRDLRYSLHWHRPDPARRCPDP